MDIKPVAWCNEQGSWHLGETPPQDFVSSWKPVYIESAITQAREEGRREGMREAAEICNRHEHAEDDFVCGGHNCLTIVTAEITRAAEGK